MFKHLPASDIWAVSPSLMPGSVTRAQFMERAAQRWAWQVDKNGDGVLSVAEKEANLAKILERCNRLASAVHERG